MDVFEYSSLYVELAIVFKWASLQVQRESVTALGDAGSCFVIVDEWPCGKQSMQHPQNQDEKQFNQKRKHIVIVQFNLKNSNNQ